MVVLHTVESCQKRFRITGINFSITFCVVFFKVRRPKEQCYCYTVKLFFQDLFITFNLNSYVRTLVSVYCYSVPCMSGTGLVDEISNLEIYVLRKRKK